jgi:hypothetical protein
VGVSLSCGSLWFIDAGAMTFIDKPISSRYLSQDDRIEIADGLAAGEPVKSIAARIGKSYQSVYREIARNRKPDGHYQPWYAHGQAHLRRRRPRPRRVTVDEQLCAVIAGQLGKRWSPAQISRWLRRRWPKRTSWHLCHEVAWAGSSTNRADPARYRPWGARPVKQHAQPTGPEGRVAKRAELLLSSASTSARCWNYDCELHRIVVVSSSGCDVDGVAVAGGVGVVGLPSKDFDKEREVTD